MLKNLFGNSIYDLRLCEVKKSEGKMALGTEQAAGFTAGCALMNNKFSPTGSECAKAQFGLARSYYQECMCS